MGGRSTLGRRPPRSRRTRLRPAPLASGRRTRDPASAASRTTSPSGRPDDLPADPSPQPDSDPLSPLNRVRPRPLRQRAAKGPRLYDWAYLELASLKADALDPTLDPTLDQSLWTRGLLVRRSLSDGSLAYFTTWCPAGTPIQKLVA